MEISRPVKWDGFKLHLLWNPNIPTQNKWANRYSNNIIPSLTPLFSPGNSIVSLKSRTVTLKQGRFQHRNFLRLLESLLKTIYDGPFNPLACLTDVGGGNNDISKLLDLVAMAKMTCSVQMAAGITYGDAMARKMGWIQITYIADPKTPTKTKVG
jgi:hypothetical protein